jgi:hypothetical protein
MSICAALRVLRMIALYYDYYSTGRVLATYRHCPLRGDDFPWLRCGRSGTARKRKTCGDWVVRAKTVSEACIFSKGSGVHFHFLLQSASVERHEDSSVGPNPTKYSASLAYSYGSSTILRIFVEYNGSTRKYAVRVGPAVPASPPTNLDFVP